MAAPTGSFYGVGARYARVLVLNAYGVPAAAAGSGAVYEGYELATLKNFNIETPDARKIDHYGGDRVRATDFLPPNAAGSAKMALGSLDLATYAALSSTKVATIGEASVVGFGTSKRGFESDVCLYAVQQGVNSSGSRRWIMDMAPVARAMFKNASMNENPAEYGVDLSLAVASKYPWGIAFSEATEGFTTAEGIKMFFDNFPVFVAWLGDNTVTKFLFPTGMQAYNATTKIHAVWVMPVSTHISAVDATATKATDGVTPTAKPAAGDIVMCLYEAANAPA
jgi:hypothetical protein